MKTHKVTPLVFLVVLIGFVYFFKNHQTSEDDEGISHNNTEELRQKHAQFIENSPFKESLQLSKKERKARGIPPNKYYEEQWELTMNPATGKPEPQKVIDLQEELRKKRLTNRVPGDKDDNKWESRGPNNVGGRTRVVLFDPNDPSHKKVYAGAVSGGLWYTNDITDENSPWIEVNDVPGNMNISCLTVDPRDSNTWYLGTGELYTTGAAVGNGVYKTTNGGITWTQIRIKTDVENELNNGIYFITSILAYDNGVSTDIFVGVGSQSHTEFLGKEGYYDSLGGESYGLYKSTDAGNSWDRIQNAIFNYIVPNDFEVTSDNIIWMATTHSGGRVFKSTDGNVWQEPSGSPLPYSDRVEIAVSSSNPNKIYALTKGVYGEGVENSQYPHIYSSVDGLETFIELPTPSDADEGISSLDFTRGQAFYDLVVEVDPSDDDIVYVGGIDLFRTEKGTSLNSSEDWQQISKWINAGGLANLNCSYVHADQHAFTFHPEDSNKAVIGCDGGVFYATDLLNAESNDVFIERNKEYNVTQFYYGGYGQDTESELILAGSQDNGTQFMNGALPGTNSSDEIYGGDGVYSTIDKDGDYMIVSYIYNNYFLFKLPYTGEHFQIEAQPQGKFINPAGLDHNKNILFSYNDSRRINRFTLQENSVIKGQIKDDRLIPGVSSFKVSPFNSNETILYVGTAGGNLFRISNAHIDPAYMIWEDLTGDEFLGSISDIEFGATENDIFVTFYSYGVQSVWYTSNGGRTWHSKEGDLPNIPVRSVLQNPLAKNEVIIGTEIGVWRTENFHSESPNWVQSYNGMRDVKVTDLDLRDSDNTILATTYGRGVFTGVFTSESSSTFTFDTETSIPDLCGLNEVDILFDYDAKGGFTESINITLTGLPENATALVEPNNQIFTEDFQITIGNLDAVKSGEYDVVVNAKSSSWSINKDLVFIVNNGNMESIKLLSPQNEETKIPTQNYSFSWEGNDNATEYQFEIAEDLLFEKLVDSVVIGDVNYIPNVELEEATTYFWRVRGLNDCAEGAYSDIQKFRTNIYCQEVVAEVNETIVNELTEQPFTYESKLEVLESLTISDLRFSIDLSYEAIHRMKFELQSPQGTIVKLFDPDCSNSESVNIDVKFDDHSQNEVDCTFYTNFSRTNSLQPMEPLTEFIGEEAQGEWIFRMAIDSFNDSVILRDWSVEICSEESLTASQILTTPFVVETESLAFITQNYLKAYSEGTSPSQQKFSLITLPEEGTLKLGEKDLEIGESFSQSDINDGILSYVNNSTESTEDYFLVGVKNGTGGYLPDYRFDIQIREEFKDDDFDGVPNENDECPTTEFNVKVNDNGCFIAYFDGDDDGITRDIDICPDSEYGKSVNQEGCSSKGNDFFGVTTLGGKYNKGVLFKIDAETKQYTKMIDFEGVSTGSYPNSGLIKGTNGRIYGITGQGGEFDFGVLYEYDVAKNTLIKKHDFNDARIPRGELIEVDEVLYGLTYEGKSSVLPFGAGTLYAFNLKDDTFKILRRFEDEENGLYPEGKLFLDKNILYGTTATAENYTGNILFKYDISSKTYTRLHNFGLDGYHAGAQSSGLTLARNGKAYGTVNFGEEKKEGILYEYDIETNTWETKLELNPSSLWLPTKGHLMEAGNGLLYGTSHIGGKEGVGVLYSYNTDTNEYKVLHEFGRLSKNSWFPVGVLIQSSSGKLYGMTGNSGNSIGLQVKDRGTIFEFDIENNKFSEVHRFVDNGNWVVSWGNSNHLLEYSFEECDKDWDKVLNHDDNCPDMANHNQKDMDNDGIGDVCDDDIDGDGILNENDNCIYVANADQNDFDEDGIGDTCDDDDKDGVMDMNDECPDTPIDMVVDLKGCSEGQLDDDNDGVMNEIDECPNTATDEEVDEQGCSESQKDDDGDGYMNNIDQCPNTLEGELVDIKGCSESQLDDDLDGVPNSIDLCPNTQGATVNEFGCVDLSPSNFKIEVVGETCLDKNNGHILIEATENYTYTAAIDGVTHDFSTSLTIDNVDPGEYSVCITMTEAPSFEQCFNLIIPEARTITGKSSSKVTAEKITETIEIGSGTAPYLVSVNGEKVLETSEETISLEVLNGDQISVSSKIPCEGVFEKQVVLSNDITVYPNPTDDFAVILLPNVDMQEVEISLFNSNQQLLSKKSYKIVYGKVKISLQDKPTGVYLLQLDLNSPVTLKVIKQ